MGWLLKPASFYATATFPPSKRPDESAKLAGLSARVPQLVAAHRKRLQLSSEACARVEAALMAELVATYGNLDARPKARRAACVTRDALTDGGEARAYGESLRELRKEAAP